jgi:ketosteroid isomerase-like protein
MELQKTMTADSALSTIGKRLHECLVTNDWDGLASMLTPDATWQLPGHNRVSGSAPVVSKAQAISSYGVSFTFEGILVSAENVALMLHNIAERDGRHLDEHVADVCIIRNGLIAGIETYLSDVDGMNAFFG